MAHKDKPFYTQKQETRTQDASTLALVAAILYASGRYLDVNDVFKDAKGIIRIAKEFCIAQDVEGGY